MPAALAASLLDYQEGHVGAVPAIEDAGRFTGAPVRTFGRWVTDNLDAFRPR